MFDLDNARFRTFKVFKNTQEIKQSNGDIIIYRQLQGRVVAVTVPISDTELAVDFAFCSNKDKFNKSYGQDMAIDRLMAKYDNEKHVFAINKNNPDFSVSDIIKMMIIEEFGDKINWLHHVNPNDIVYEKLC